MLPERNCLSSLTAFFFFPVCLLSCRTTPRRAADPFATLVRSCMLGCDAHAAVSTFVSVHKKHGMAVWNDVS